jgi:hypothetical protein
MNFMWKNDMKIMKMITWGPVSSFPMYDRPYIPDNSSETRFTIVDTHPAFLVPPKWPLLLTWAELEDTQPSAAVVTPTILGNNSRTYTAPKTTGFTAESFMSLESLFDCDNPRDTDQMQLQQVVDERTEELKLKAEKRAENTQKDFRKRKVSHALIYLPLSCLLSRLPH